MMINENQGDTQVSPYLSVLIDGLYEVTTSEILPVEETAKLILSVLDNTGYEYDVTENGITVRYPDDVVTNSYGRTTPLLGMYVRWPFEPNPDYYDKYVPEFIRSTYTASQYAKKYMHSHLSVYSELTFWTDRACFGSSSTFQYFNYDEAVLQGLTLLPLFFKTESTNHSPYHRLSDLSAGLITAPSILNNETLEKVTSFLLEHQLIDVVVSSGRKFDFKIIVNGKGQEIILETFPIFQAVFDNGKYYKSRQSKLADVDQNIEMFRFKNQPVKFTIIDDSQDDENQYTINLPLLEFTEAHLTKKYTNDKKFIQWLTTQTRATIEPVVSKHW